MFFDMFQHQETLAQYIKYGLEQLKDSQHALEQPSLKDFQPLFYQNKKFHVLDNLNGSAHIRYGIT